MGALWIKQKQDGTKFMSGVLQDLGGDINIAVFKNDKKEQPNHPDYNIVLSERQQASNPTYASKAATVQAPSPKIEPEPSENLPF